MKKKTKTNPKRNKFNKYLLVIVLVLILLSLLAWFMIRNQNLQNIAKSLEVSAQPMYQLESYLQGKYGGSISESTPIHKKCDTVHRIKFDKGEKWCGYEGEYKFDKLNIDSLAEEIKSWSQTSFIEIGDFVDINTNNVANEHQYSIELNDGDINTLCYFLAGYNTQGSDIKFSCTRQVPSFLPGFPIED